jgi:hypothetical protein
MNESLLKRSKKETDEHYYSKSKTEAKRIFFLASAKRMGELKHGSIVGLEL